MSTTAKDKGGKFVLPPAGTHKARCYQVIDLGHQKKEWNNVEGYDPQVFISFELCDEMMKATEKLPVRPFSVSKFYTLSLHEKATLRKELDSWRGRAFTEAELEGFDVEQVLDAAAMLNCVELLKNGQRYCNVAAVMRLPKHSAAPTPRDYVRVCDRAPGTSEPVPAQHDEPDVPADWNHGISDDDVPF